MFDNSQNHHAKPSDALSVNILNLKDGGKNPRQCETDGILVIMGNVPFKSCIHLNTDSGDEFLTD